MDFVRIDPLNMEPICEAKFSENSNGFRPNRSAETAIAQCMRLIQVQHMYYVVDLDIKGFFDNINHRKLLRQIWALGIRDKKLICIIKEMLKSSCKDYLSLSGAKSQGIKQLMAGGGIVLIGMNLIPQLATLFG